MGLYSRIDRAIGGWLPGGVKKQTTKVVKKITSETTAPTTVGITVTDFKSGESVKTTTVTPPTGNARTTRTYRGGGGSSRSAQVIATAKILQQPTTTQQKLVEIKNIGLSLEQKQRNLIIAKSSGEQRIRELMRKNKAMGILTSRSSATRVINARIKSENRKKFIMTGEVTAVKQPTGFVARNIKKLNDLQKRRATSSIRNKQRNIINELKLLGLTIATTVVSGVTAFVALPSTLVSLAKNPAQLKRVPVAISEGGANFGQLLRTSPTEALGLVTGELLLLKGTGKVFKVTGKVGNRATARLSPKFRGVKSGRITIKTTRGTTTLRVGGTVKRISEPLSKQARVAGRKVTAVSAQADELVKFTRGSRVVRKPIPGEATLSRTTKRLLAKFDQGTITPKQLTLLDDAIRLETKGAGNLLERSLYADPRGRFRPSRLGVNPQKDASLLDILSGDVSWRANKPQILVFENVKVAKFPSSLDDVAKALKSGKTLTSSQAKRLLKWQLKQEGKFKPIGALSKEPEITLAPGEIVKKVKKVGVTIINGRKVSIVQARVVKASKRTTQLMKKSRTGKITAKELRELAARVSRESGFKTTLSRRSALRPRGRMPVRGIRTRKTPRVSKVRRRATPKRKTPTRKTLKRPSKRPPKKPKRPGRSTRPPTRPKRPGRSTIPPTRPKRPGRPPKRPRRPTKPPVKPPVRLRKPKNFRSKTLSKSVNVFYVKEKIRGKIKNLTPRPLSLTDARDFLAYRLDNRLSRSGFFEPIGKVKKVVRPPKSMQGYFSRNKRKLRPFKIRVGKKKAIRNGYIEKTKFNLDTRGEKRMLKQAKRRSRRVKRKGKRRIVKRKPIKRKTVKRRIVKRKRKR